jgi:hypothetical protein
MDCVVEVARVFAVDGHDGKLAQVGALGDLIGEDRVIKSAGFGKNLVGKSRRQAVAKHQRPDLHFGIVRIAHHADHRRFRRRQGGAVAGDFGGDHLARLRSGATQFERNRRSHSRVHRNQIASAAQLAVGAEQPLLPALDHPDDVHFRSAARLSIDPRHDPIAVHDAAHLAAVEI